MTTFKKRVFGCAIIKSINSNYNADFSHQPRTLPDGVVYATDKALKYTVKNFIKDVYPGEKVFYFKRFDNKKAEFVPFSLMEAFCEMFPNLAEISKDTKTEKVKEGENEDEEGGKLKVKLKATKKQVAKAILECVDIRLFGATFAMKGQSKKENIAISIHGPLQINHGVNIWEENNIFSEQIMSPFRNPDEKSQDKEATTLGRQSKLQEGHYLHHFSINPQNLSTVLNIVGENIDGVTENDITIVKEALRKGASYYDSASKAGTDNEILLWVELKVNSKLVLPNFTQLVKLEKVNGKNEFDFEEVAKIIGANKDEIEKTEIYYLPESTVLRNLPSGINKYDLTSGNSIS